MNRRHTYILLLLIIMPFLFLQVSCDRRPAKDTLKSKEDADESPQTLAQKILSFNLEGYRDNGKKKWELKGAYADILANTIKLDYITAKVYGEGGSITLKARTGVYNKTTKDVHLEKNVIGKTSDGARILTDSMDWHEKTESVTTDALVRVEKDNLVSIGRGAVGTPNLKQVELKKDVTVQIKENPPTLITCDGPLVVNYQKNIATLNNNVKITDKRGEMYADFMKVLFDPKDKKITRVVAIGNVKIKREGNYTYSERAIYNARNGKVRLIGKPKIVVFPKEGKKEGVLKNASAGN